MFMWVALANPPWYLACYTAASLRHAAWRMPYSEHRRLMRLVYGV